MRQQQTGIDFKMLRKKTHLQYFLGEKQDCISNIQQQYTLQQYTLTPVTKKEGEVNKSVMRPQTHTTLNFKLFIEF